MKKLLLNACLLSVVTLMSCEKDADPIMDYSRDAVLVSNEGSFQKSDASVSYISKSTGFTKNDIIKKENNIAVLGDVLQDIGLKNDQLYMVLNNSGKVTVANATTLKLEGEINGLEMPRYFAALNDTTAYVTEWVSYDGNGRVAILDLTKQSVVGTIPVGVMPEKLLVHNGKVYVVNNGSNTVSVIDTKTNAVVRTIAVTNEPNSLVVDNNNTLWVLSNGNKNWQLTPDQYTAGALTKINLTNYTVSRTFPFANARAMASNLIRNSAGTTLYYVYNNKVYQLGIEAAALNEKALIDRGTYVERGFYGLGIDPAGSMIYAGKAPSFTDNGWVVRYNVSTGDATDSVMVGVAPNGFLFR